MTFVKKEQPWGNRGEYDDGILCRRETTDPTARMAGRIWNREKVNVAGVW